MNTEYFGSSHLKAANVHDFFITYKYHIDLGNDVKTVKSFIGQIFI